MTVQERIELEGVYRLVEEISKNNRDAHEDIKKQISDLAAVVGDRLDAICKHCDEREREVDKAISAAAASSSPFEVSIRTVGKVSAVALVNAGIIAGILGAAGVFN